jgi:archaetidylinositol phosphate synthase
MVLDRYRSIADKFLLPIANHMLNANPNIVSGIALSFALAAGIAFYVSYMAHWLLILAVLFTFLNALFDALDGKIARLTEKSSAKGDFLDHVLDRYADIFILGGIALSPYCNQLIGMIAVLGVLLLSYMGTQAQAVGCKREYGGILGRADRLILLIIVPIVQFIFLIFIPDGKIGVYNMRFTILEYMMIWFAIAGNITAIQRIFSTWKKLNL